MSRSPRLTLTLMLLALASLIPQPRQHARAAQDPGVIAYVRFDAATGSTIHLINPDGSNDRVIKSLPKSAIDFVPQLAWKPDATALAFSSDHEASQSLYTSDIFTIRPDGSGLRRLTNGPDPSAFSSYAKGSVTVDVHVFNGGGPYLIYMAGAPTPKVVTGSQTVTFDNVADFGAGRQQGIIAINGKYRWFNSAAADVQPGKTISGGSLFISGGGLVYAVDRPTWRSDGAKVGFVGAQFAYVPANPPDGSLGTTLIDPTFDLGFLGMVEWSPVASKANQILYTEWDIDHGQIFLTTEGSSAQGQLLYSYDPGELLQDIKWLPDGSGFLFALTGDIQSYSNIFEYNFATQQAHQITHLTSSFVGHLSVSNDGQSVVFERAPDADTLADLWIMQRDGSNMHLLAQHAARPAWSPRTPPPLRYTYLPALMR